ncbi:hypothetical protein K438DRAFT_1941264 [Mycena galopus ATCC 62051]|nr:hypothetical protein K438DRAFT_1941264 [Mycena galopus ATCC 62051]
MCTIYSVMVPCWDQGKWYLQKQRNPWYLPSVNQYLSKILLDDWEITPRTTNIAETSHAATNTDTSTQLPLLRAILVTQKRDKDDVEEIHQIVRDGIMRKHWNGPSEREHLSEQRVVWSARQREERNDDLATYDALAKDREEGQEEWRFSLTRGHALQEQIQLVQAELKLDKRRTDLSEELNTLRAALEFEKQARREIDTQMKVLRGIPLKGVQNNWCQPVAALSDTAIPGHRTDDLNNSQEECFDESMGQLEYFPSDYIISSNSTLNDPLPSPAHHPGPLELHWNAAFELDPALERNYHEGETTQFSETSNLASLCLLLEIVMPPIFMEAIPKLSCFPLIWPRSPTKPNQISAQGMLGV